MDQEQIQHIGINDIDPESTVNVRRTDIKESRERLAESIKATGYHIENPVLLRPHPNGNSQYAYECVAGRSRFLGAGDAGLDQVPAIVLELDDDQAHRRSYDENERRQSLTAGDKIYWFTQRFKQYRTEGYTADQSREKTADYYGEKLGAIKAHLTMTHLPSDLIEQLDNGLLPERIAKSIAQRYEGVDEDSRDGAMRDAAKWSMSLSEDDQKKAHRAIGKTPLPAPPDSLDQTLELIKIEESRGPVKVVATIPATANVRLTELAEQHGFISPEAFLPSLIGDAIRQMEQE